MNKDTTDLEQDLSDDFNDGVSTRRLNIIENRLNKLEQRLDAACEEIGDTAVKLMEHREAYARNAQAGEQAALNTLSKAASATQRRSTPEGIMERAEKVLTDPSAMGMVASYVSSGQLVKAQNLLAEAEARADQEGEDGALERVESQIKEHSVVASVSELGEQVANLQRGLNAVLSRLSALETRQTAAPAPAQTVAKAGTFGRRQVQQPDPRETAEGLMTRAEGVIDSPARIGHLASMAQAGQLDELRRIVEQAELAHETAVKKRDRRTF